MASTMRQRGHNHGQSGGEDQRKTADSEGIDTVGRTPDERRPSLRRICPECGTATVNVQGVLDCPDCRWPGGRQ